MKNLYWIGWIMLIWAWADFASGWLFQIDIWKEVFGLIYPAPVHYSPMMVGAFGVVFIALGRAFRA